MNILILTDRYAPEARAAAYLSQHLAEELVRRGHRVCVLTKKPTEFVPDLGPVASSETLNGVWVERLEGMATSHHSIFRRGVDQLYLAAKLCRKAITTLKPDVAMVYSPPLPWVISAIFLRLFRRIPYVINLHDIYPQVAIDLGVLRNKTLIALARMLESFAYATASQIVVAAPASRIILINESGVKASKIHAMYNYVDTDVCLPGSRMNQFRDTHALLNEYVVLYAGLMGLAQDLGIVIDAARLMRNRREVVFIMMGDGPNADQWKKSADGLPNMRFLSPASNEAYYETLRAADVCLVPLAGNFKAPAIPGKVGTIMAAGRPLIAIVPPGNDTIALLNEAKCGIWVEPDNPVKLKEAIDFLVANPSHGQTLGENGRAYAVEHFNLTTAVHRWEEIFSIAMGKHGAQAATPNPTVAAG